MNDTKLEELKKFLGEVKVVPVSYMTGKDKILLVSFEELVKLKILAAKLELPIKSGYND
jgi:hypothetical protein